ncbi:sterol desaturase family protein [Mesorhizobium sp. PL10]
MVDDLQYGTRNKRGDYQPNEPLSLPPITSLPFSATKTLLWLRDYLFGFNFLFFVTSLVWWVWLMPDFQAMATFSWGWILHLLVLNWVAIVAFYGFLEWRFYVRRAQDRRFKFNGKFPSEQPSDVFMFKSQNIDNFIRSFLICVPVGTAVEVVALWAFANGTVPMIAFAQHPIWFAVLVLVAPIIHEANFFFIHRFIHWGPMYRYVHSVHHNSVNPSPWSSLSMHPVEGFLYFASTFWHLVLFSNPFIVVYQWNLAAFGAVVGHIGFDKMEVAENTTVNSHAYAHYLHHKYFEVNYCDDGALPWDRWFGTWHDGSAEGERRMQERFLRKRERLDRKQDAAAPVE